MRVVVLVDNQKDPQSKFSCEHGLSIYFEADGLRWLFDVGGSEAFLVNARKLKVRIQDVDYLVLSHAHLDHTGGLSYFLHTNRKAKVILSTLSDKRLFVSYRKTIRHDITIEHRLVQENIDRFLFVDQNTNITSNVQIIKSFCSDNPLPKGNKLLYSGDEHGEIPDDFSHELAMVVREESRLILFTGCAHHGLLNTLESAISSGERSGLSAIIGGIHLIDSDEYWQYEDEAEQLVIARKLVDDYPAARLITGHCTGKQAMERFARVLGDRLVPFYSGAEFTL